VKANFLRGGGLFVLLTVAASATFADTGADANAGGAARTDNGSLEEIIVTARKREESAQSVPIAITIFSSTELEEREVETIGDVARFTPNLIYDTGASLTGGGLASSIFIRGIGQADFSSSSDPGVGLYIDGVYFGRSFGSVLDTVDVGQVEVLRGPQGTLFGKNTIGGAISITSAMPGDAFGGWVEADVGSYSEHNFKASVNLPLTDGLAAKLSVSDSNRDGYTRDPTDGVDYDNIDRFAGRGVLSWTPTGGFSATTIVDGSQWRENGPGIHLLAVNPAPGTLLNSFYPTIGQFITAGENVTYQSGSASLLATGMPDPRNNLDGYGISETLKVALSPNVTLTSISAYRGVKTDAVTDGDGSPLTESAVEYYVDQHQVSEEMRLNGQNFDERLKWVAGVYYLRETISEEYNNRVFPGIFNIDPNQTDDLTNVTKAVFVDATYKVLDNLSLDVGERYNRDNKDFVGQSVFCCGLTGVFLPPGSALGDSSSSWTPKVSIDLQVTPDLLTYVSYAEGFKEGGINPQLTSPADFSRYGPEHDLTYEVGAKSEWFEHRLRVNADAFTSYYSGLQERVTLNPGQLNCPEGPLPCGRVLNSAEYRIQGVEGEITALPVRGLEIAANFGYIHDWASYVDPILISAGVLNYGDKLPKTPDWNGSFSVQYAMPINGLGTLAPRVDYSYRGKTFQDVQNSPQIAQGAYGLLNARVSLTRNNWEIAVAGKNLTNQIYLTSGYDYYSSIGGAWGLYGPPRTFTVSLKYHFGTE
jgi:iron complex outermembrane receptor protein